MPRGLANRITIIDSSGVGIQREIKGLDVSHSRHALKVDVGLRELRADVSHIVGHAAQDRVDHGLSRVAARRAVAMDLLDPSRGSRLARPRF